MRITRETDYALIALTYLAKAKDATSASSLAEECELNLSLISKVLKLLVKAELLSSTRGVYGGYTLTASANDISLLDVIVAIEGPMEINACINEENPCDKALECNLAPHWQIINQSLYDNFSKITLQTLLEKPIKLEKKLSKIDKELKTIPMNFIS